MAKTQLYFFGNSCISDIELIIKTDLPKKILLVTGKNSFKYCGAEVIFEKILKNISFVRFMDFDENPKIEDVEKGIKLFKEHNCDYVIAVGGGSVIDMAKLINIGQAHKSSLEVIILNPNSLNKPGKKLIAIPTTAGAGSEATHFAVIYIGKEKYSLSHKEYILPDVAVLIPSLTYSMNSYQTAVSGIDAFAQAMESYWSIDSTSESKEYALEALKLILKSLPAAVHERNQEARDRMAKASYLAGKAINISKTTGAHAISYALTSYFNIPHGHAVAITLAEWFVYNKNVNQENLNDDRGLEYVQKIMSELSSLFNKEMNLSPHLAINQFIENIGLETRFSKLKIKRSDIKLIAESINLERIKNNPCKISNKELELLLYRVY